MAKRIKANEVISKKIEGEKEKLIKDTEKTHNICLTKLNKYKVYFILLLVLIILKIIN